MWRLEVALVGFSAIVLLVGCSIGYVYRVERALKGTVGEEAAPEAVRVETVQRALRALAGNRRATRARVAKLRARQNGDWTDGAVGITASGYLFLYDLPSGTNATSTPGIFYLPDERRTILSRAKLGSDLNARPQVRDKTELLRLIE